jgi:hypothetical protein
MSRATITAKVSSCNSRSLSSSPCNKPCTPSPPSATKLYSAPRRIGRCSCRCVPANTGKRADIAQLGQAIGDPTAHRQIGMGQRIDQRFRVAALARGRQAPCAVFAHQGIVITEQRR